MAAECSKFDGVLGRRPGDVPPPPPSVVDNGDGRMLAANRGAVPRLAAGKMTGGGTTSGGMAAVGMRRGLGTTGKADRRAVGMSGGSDGSDSNETARRAPLV